MPRPRETTPITCQNPDCQYYLTETGKDFLKNGRNCAGNQQYFCKHCRKYFVETKNTPLYNSRLDLSRVELICKHNMEKTSIREVERVTGHHRDTVSRYYHLIGEHADIMNECYLRVIAPGRVELDELWTFVQKKNKNCEDPRQEVIGDFWIYTEINSDSGLLIAQCGRKRSNATCARFLDSVFERVQLPDLKIKIIVSTDGNSQYVDTLSDMYCESFIDYGQVIKRKQNNRLVEIIRVKILGDPTICSISTSIVEGYNNKIRQRFSRFARKTASFSKSVFSCINALNLFQFVNNFIDLEKTNERHLR